jgi:TetR/AcrR family transcriptional repressor of nem operon
LSRSRAGASSGAAFFATAASTVTLARAVDEPELARSILVGSLDLSVAQAAD